MFLLADHVVEIVKGEKKKKKKKNVQKAHPGRRSRRFRGYEKPQFLLTTIEQFGDAIPECTLQCCSAGNFGPGGIYKTLVGDACS